MKKPELKHIIKDNHIFLLTDDTGIFQHSKYSVPDPRFGYTTDDNARALIMAIMLYENLKKKKYLKLIYRYASFILNAQNESGKFKNFMNYERKWLEDEGSEDCFGRCIWALGYGISNDCIPTGIKSLLSFIFEKALPNISSLKAIRAKAYSIVGLRYLESSDAKKIISKTADDLVGKYNENSDDNWKWFEDTISYGNNILPHALFIAYETTKNEKYLSVARESLEFLEKATFRDGKYKPVGCKGWFAKGKTMAEFDEQPIEACEAVLMYIDAYNITGCREYKKKAKICHSWYHGYNSQNLPLVDYSTGGCFDGLTETGVNQNLGSESLVSYIISEISINSLLN